MLSAVVTLLGTLTLIAIVAAVAGGVCVCRNRQDSEGLYVFQY